jgi:ectoine hydroxylase-related dioxygenase (phytanoyl-CoA dioxygenase family)
MFSPVHDRGFTLVRQLVPLSFIEEIRATLGSVLGAGQRGMLAHSEVAKLAASEALTSVVRPFLPGPPRAVRAIFFDKSPGSNWLVPWHQDLSIAVRQRVEVPGFGPWSVKEGLIHVQPPVEVLEGMLTLRLHLDVADETNGALRVLPGSHANGRLSATEIERLRAAIPEETCRAEAGDAFLMRPLILHASGRSVSEGRRRVLHIEYAGLDLPSGLQWNEAA